MSPLPDLLTTEDVANYLKVDIETVRRWVWRGELQASQIGNEYRFTEAAVADFVNRQRVQNALPSFLRGPVSYFMRLFGLSFRRNRMERFTVRSRRVLVSSEAETRKRGEKLITPMHILLALAMEKGGIGGHVLSQFDITSEKIQALLSPIPEKVEANISLDLSNDTKKMLENSVDSARKLRLTYIGTEHLLLGLLYDSQVIQAFAQWGISAEQVRERVVSAIELGEVSDSP